MTQRVLNLSDYVSPELVRDLVERARLEDLGPASRDVTSLALVPDAARTVAVMRSRATGVVAGLALLPTVVEAYDKSVTLRTLLRDGDALSPGSVAAEFTGSLRSVLAIERVALNLVTHLSGIATLTSKYVHAAAGTKARICDTRKTLPALRGLQKYAVACGGGLNHRIGLYDAMLVKDNHIAHLSLDALPVELARAIRAARASDPAMKFVEVEVDRLDQLQRVLSMPADAQPNIVLLDNMKPVTLREAVAMRDAMSPTVELEASGGVNLETVGSIAATGVDRISVGALTHSAPSLDLGLDIGV